MTSRFRLVAGVLAVVGLTVGASSTGKQDLTPQAVPSVVQVGATRETVPVQHSGDAADDAAIWVNQGAPANSLIIGNDKKGALETYNLDGIRQQRIVTGPNFWGNVDVRQGIAIGARTVDIAAVSHNGLQVYGINTTTGNLTNITAGGRINTNGEGVCLYHSRTTNLTSVFTITILGRVRQYTLTDPNNDGLVSGTLVREFQVGSEAEGCVADDANGALYIDEEDTATWRYGAEPGSGTTRTAVDRVGPSGHLVSDAEGVTIVDTGGGGGFLIVSVQNVNDPNRSYFTVYDRVTNAYRSAFRITDSSTADGCERTDGIAAYYGSLGSAFPRGVFVCQDNNNRAPGAGNQDFKLTRLETVVDLP